MAVIGAHEGYPKYILQGHHVWHIVICTAPLSTPNYLEVALYILSQYRYDLKLNKEYYLVRPSNLLGVM